MAGVGVAEVRLVDLLGGGRERALPLVREGFEGIYRWHAKRTLREAGLVRGVELEGLLLGVSMLERLVPEVGYVAYLVVAGRRRRQGVGGRLLDDALARFRADGAEVVYGAVPEENLPSRGLFGSRGFRLVERRELGFREGGLGAWGLRSRMRIVSGELLFGLRIAPPRSDALRGAVTP